MAHKFDRAGKDPYAEAARQVESKLPVDRLGLDAAASEDLFSTLGDAIVTALGDVAAQAFRHGISDPDRLHRLAAAVGAAAETILLSYRGEVDPEPALQSLESDPRLAGLPRVDQDDLKQEVENTRQLESLLLHARRLPALLDFAGSLGLQVREDAVDEGAVLVPKP